MSTLCRVALLHLVVVDGAWRQRRLHRLTGRVIQCQGGILLSAQMCLIILRGPVVWVVDRVSLIGQNCGHVRRWTGGWWGFHVRLKGDLVVVGHQFVGKICVTNAKYLIRLGNLRHFINKQTLITLLEVHGSGAEVLRSRRERRVLERSCGAEALMCRCMCWAHEVVAVHLISFIGRQVVVVAVCIRQSRHGWHVVWWSHIVSRVLSKSRATIREPHLNSRLS